VEKIKEKYKSRAGSCPVKGRLRRGSTKSLTSLDREKRGRDNGINPVQVRTVRNIASRVIVQARSGVYSKYFL
jgi:hypothetical protein